MHIAKLQMSDFRLYEKFETDFSSSMNVVTGSNGIGKTTILEAVHYLALSKSFKTNRDEEAVKFEADFFLNDGEFSSELSREEKVSVSFGKSSGKQITIDGRKAAGAFELVGKYPLVLLAPEDSHITFGPPEERRKFLNGAISQFDKIHLSDLIDYRRLLRQRNAAIASVNSPENSMLETVELLEIQLSKVAERIVKTREVFSTEFKEVFDDVHYWLSDGKREATVEYSPSVKGNAKEIAGVFAGNRAADLNVGYTLRGPHRDTLKFVLDGRGIKDFGSQGENKIFLVALKLAEGVLIEKRSGVKPIYLLDDILTEMDKNHAGKTLEKVSGMGQVILTSTDVVDVAGAFGLNISEMNAIGLS